MPGHWHQAGAADRGRPAAPAAAAVCVLPERLPRVPSLCRCAACPAVQAPSPRAGRRRLLRQRRHTAGRRNTPCRRRRLRSRCGMLRCPHATLVPVSRASRGPRNGRFKGLGARARGRGSRAQRAGTHPGGGGVRAGQQQQQQRRRQQPYQQRSSGHGAAGQRDRGGGGAASPGCRAGGKSEPARSGHPLHRRPGAEHRGVRGGSAHLVAPGARQRGR